MEGPTYWRIGKSRQRHLYNLKLSSRQHELWESRNITGYNTPGDRAERTWQDWRYLSVFSYQQGILISQAKSPGTYQIRHSQPGSIYIHRHAATAESMASRSQSSPDSSYNLHWISSKSWVFWSTSLEDLDIAHWNSLVVQWAES